MNNLTRLLLATASVTAMVVSAESAWASCSYDTICTISPTGGGTIVFTQGEGTTADQTAGGSGVEIGSIGGASVSDPNAAVTIDSVTIDKTVAGSFPQALLINGEGAVNVKFTGAGSTITEESTDQGAALQVTAAGDATIDFTGITSGSNTLTGTQGIVVFGDNINIMTKAGDQILANQNGSGGVTYNVAEGGAGTAGIFANAQTSVTITNNGTIGSDGTHNFDIGIATFAPAVTITNSATGSITAAGAGVLGEGGGTMTVNNYGLISGGSTGVQGNINSLLTVHNYEGGTIVATGAVGEGFGVVNEASGQIDVTNDTGGRIVGSVAGIKGYDYTDVIHNTGLITSGTIVAGEVQVAAGVGSGIDLLYGGTVINGVVDGSAAGQITGGQYGILIEDSGQTTTGAITNYAGSTITGGTDAIMDSTAGTVTIDNYGTITGGIVVNNAEGLGVANINLHPGSTTGNIDTSVSNDGSTITLYSGTATLAPASFGTLTGGASDSIVLTGAGDFTGANGEGGSINLNNVTGFGTGGITKTGTGVWAFTENSSSAIPITVTQGTIHATGEGHFGTGIITTHETDGGSPVLQFAEGGYSNPIHLNNTGAPTTIRASEGYVDLNGVISEVTPGQAVLFTGGSTIVLGAANTYTGGTTISGGTTVEIGTTNALSSGSAVTITDTSELDIDNKNQTLGTVTVGTTLSPGGTLFANEASNVTIASLVMQGGTIQTNGEGYTRINVGSLSGDSTSVFETHGTGAQGEGGIYIGGDNSSSTFGGKFTGEGYIEKDGTGTLTLAGDDSGFDGRFYVQTGTLAAGSATALGTGEIGINSGATLDLHGFSNSTPVNYLFGEGTITNNGAQTATLSVNYGEFGGTITDGTSKTALTIAEGGFVGLYDHVSTFSGPTTIQQNATLLLGEGASIPNSPVTDDGDLDISEAVGSASIGSLAGTGTVHAGGNTLVITNGAGDFSGVIEDGGNGGGTGASLEIAGGRQILSGTNTFTGITTIDSGATLQLGDGGATGSVTGPLIDNGTLAFDLAGGETISTAITGTGGLEVDDGTMTITAAQPTLTGTTTVASGATLALTGAGSLPGTPIVDDGTFNIAGAAGDESVPTVTGSGTVTMGANSLTLTHATGTFSGAIGGTGSLTVEGGGTYDLTGTSTYSGGTNVGADTTLGLEAPASAGTGNFNFAAGSALSFLANGSYTANAAFAADAPTFNTNGNTVTWGGVISGAGDLAVTGGGTLILTNAANTYAGGTEVTGGTTLNVAADGDLGGAAPLQLGDATTTGTLQFGSSFTLGSGRAVTLNAGGGAIDTQAFTDTIGQAIGGTGGLTKLGTGTLVLGGTNTYSGATSVQAGTLQVNGSVAGPVGVATGGTLAGTGTVGATTVASGGTIAPGSGGVGTLSVNGNLVLAAGSTTAIDVTPTTADQIAVTGTASLGGTLALNPAAGTYANGTVYQLITTTGGTSGAFTSVTGDNFGGEPGSVVISATGVALDVGNAAPITFDFGSYGKTPNAVAAGNALSASDPTGALYTALGNLVATDTPATAGALQQLSGEIHASIRSAMIEDGRAIRHSVLDHLAQDPDGMTIWGTAFDETGSIDGDGNASSMHHSQTGVIAGVDIPVNPDFRIGVAGAITNQREKISNVLSGAHGDTGHIVGYATWTGGAWTASGGVDYGWGTSHITRQITALSETDRGSENNDLTQVFGDVGYKLTADRITFQPYADLAYVSANTGKFNESGGVGVLSGGSKDDNETYSTLGVRAQLGDGMNMGQSVTLVPKVDIGWEHAFDSVRPDQTLSFTGTGQNFTVMGVPIEKDAADIQAGFDIALSPQAVLSLTYDGSFGSDAKSNGFRGGLIWKF